MLAKQKEIKKKRLQQRLRGDTGKKKKKKTAKSEETSVDGEQGEDEKPIGPSAVALKLQARIRAKLVRSRDESVFGNHSLLQ